MLGSETVSNPSFLGNLGVWHCYPALQANVFFNKMKETSRCSFEKLQEGGSSLATLNVSKILAAKIFIQKLEIYVKLILLLSITLSSVDLH